MEKMIKKIMAAMLAVAVLCVFAGCSSNKPAASSQAASSAAVMDDAERYVNIQITMENGDSMKFQLDRQAAPLTVDNFVSLVEEKFYDGLTFHRIIPDFMIQGGDPEGTGMGGSDETVKGEFSSNGWDNPIAHTRGVISMARSSEPDSASSQFFIVRYDNDNAHGLDGGYAAFGIMTEGFDVLDSLSIVATDENDKPLKPVVIESIRVIG